MRQPKIQKKEDNLNYLFYSQTDVSEAYSAENEIRYIIVTAIEGGDRGEWDIGFPLLTFQNPEEGGIKSPKRLWIKR